MHQGIKIYTDVSVFCSKKFSLKSSLENEKKNQEVLFKQCRRPFKSFVDSKINLSKQISLQRETQINSVK